MRREFLLSLWFLVHTTISGFVPSQSAFPLNVHLPRNISKAVGVESPEFNSSHFNRKHPEHHDGDLALVRVKRRLFRPYRTGKEEALQMSRTLNWLLQEERYNKQVRPGFGSGRPVEIVINMVVNSLGPIDETTQTFSLDCYFRQSWRDERLSFNATGLSVSELSLDWKILTEIWKPDTFFVNGKDSTLHKITVPNRFSRLMPDGSISFSQRLTVHAVCPMDLFKFPLDSQECSLHISSYGYPGQELVYRWKNINAVEAGKLPMSQFSFKNLTYGVSLSKTNRKLEEGRRVDSVAFVEFFVERQTGYFLLQIYAPLLLMVFCSWVSFWIVKTDAPGRAALGITTVLSVAKIGFVGGAAKPEVPYATALDTFVIICFVWVFASLIEFAIINFISVFINRFKLWEKEQAEKEDAEKAEEKLKANLLKKLQRRIMESLKKSQMNMKLGKTKVPPETETSAAAAAEDVAAAETDDAVAANGNVSTAIVQRAPIAREEKCEVTFIDDDGGSSGEKEECNCGAGAATKNNSIDHDEEKPTDAAKKPTRPRSTKRRAPSWRGTLRRRRRRKAAESEDETSDAEAEGAEALRDFWPFLISWAERLGRRFGRPVPEMYIYTDTDDALENIDAFSRKGFPLSFGIAMLIYWTVYLYIL